jgi:acetyl esterase/lipase/ketosteroid isomerase-like protein
LIAMKILMLTLCLVAAMASEMRGEDPPPDPELLRRMAELVNRPVVYAVPGMDQVQVRKDLVYKKSDDPNLKMDVYTPPGLAAGEKRPAVIFIHGGADVKYQPKSWGIFQSWGRLTAASGMVGVTFSYRQGYPKTITLDSASDVADAIAYVRANASNLGIDKDHLCLAAYSGGGPMLSPFLRGAPDYIRCVVGFYVFMDIRQSGPFRASETPETLGRFSPIVRIGEGTGRFTPIFLAQGGRDEVPTLQNSVERFVTEALGRHVPLTFLFHPEAPHGFDNQLADDRSREIVRGALEFMRWHLGLAGGPPPGSRQEQEKSLVELERRRSQAIWTGDLQTLAGIYADDFRGLLANGHYIDKAGLFEMFKGQDPDLRFTVEDLDARVLGATAVTHGKITGRNPKGEIVLLSMFTHVYAWRDGRWQAVEGASTPLRAG